MPRKRVPDNLALMTHDEVGAELGVSGALVGLIERRALAKLKAALQARGVTAADLAGDAEPDGTRAWTGEK
ncbi:hypothetical protein [Thioalkalivibrio thiocyanodenitrificans]|uniref:hypothetical protein n=1 Tax=Thioalkalivibrio thiocyanodenitrificans TaxID=243063 RepID=UPI00036B81FC|nr:hypothetical protein [Thioalkalivibrio thiocyanodenitrificans]